MLVNIEAITISTDKRSDEFVIHVPLEYDYLYSSPHRRDIIRTLQDYYFVFKGSNLAIFGVPNPHLKEFRTSLSDRKKGKTKMPSSQFTIESYHTNNDKSNESAKIEQESSITLFQRSTKDKMSKLDDFVVHTLIGKGSYG
jgi:hypothetical protein